METNLNYLNSTDITYRLDTTVISAFKFSINFISSLINTHFNKKLHRFTYTSKVPQRTVIRFDVQELNRIMYNIFTSVEMQRNFYDMAFVRALRHGAIIEIDERVSYTGRIRTSYDEIEIKFSNNTTCSYIHIDELLPVVLSAQIMRRQTDIIQIMASSKRIR